MFKDLSGTIFKKFLYFTTLFFMSSSLAFAATRLIEDDAKMFSQETIKQAQSIVDETYYASKPHKEVFVKTVKSLTTANAEDMAENIFRDKKIDGVLIFISEQPRKLVISVGRNTEHFFKRKDDVRAAMLEQFKQDKMDAGLLAGLKVLREDLPAVFDGEAPRQQAPAKKAFGAFVPATGSEISDQSTLSGGGLWPIIKIALFIFAIIVIFRIVRNLSTRRNMPHPGMNPQQRMSYGYQRGGFGGPGFGGGGGGWGSAILGGLFGSMAGNWMYDRFFGGHAHGAPFGHDSSTTSFTPADQQMQNDFFSSDDGNIGSSIGSDWSSGDSGGGFDGGGGGDW